MNDTIDYKISVMQAYRAGEKIEHRNTKRSCGGETKWFETSDPQWHWWYCDYRVKPQEPRRIWVNMYQELRNSVPHISRESADAEKTDKRIECIEFVEVTPEIRKALSL